MKIDKHLLIASEQDEKVISDICLKTETKFKTIKEGYPTSIIIHFTAGSSAKSSVEHFKNKDTKASAHLVIDKNGDIYQVVPFDTVAWHAGNSHYNGRSNFNEFSIGIELDNPGELMKSGNTYKSWFGTSYSPDLVISAVHRNQTKITYWHSYTQIQIQRCKEICELLINAYKINEILGHEEIAPKRKIDPGPAFPLDKMRMELLTKGSRIHSASITSKKGKVNTNLLNIREDAGSQFDKIAKPLKKGADVKIIDEYNGWYKVETKITGWVSKAFIKE
jgi:N-acetylmuramoyl-L-alanine amidase